MPRAGGREKHREQLASRDPTGQAQINFNKQKQIESLEKRRRDLEKKNDELEKKNDDLEKKYNDLERKKNDLQIANQELHDFCAKTEEQKDQLTNDVITARNERDEINKEKQRLKESGDAAAKSAEEYHHYMTCAVNARDQVVDGYDTVMEQKKELQSLVESYHADLSDKEEELKRTTDAYNDIEARFRALEDENINLEMEMAAMNPAIDMMNVIHDKLAESFEEMGKELTPQELIRHIDELEEARIPKVPSGLSLNSDLAQAVASTKNGGRKTSVSDELQKASEDMDDDAQEDAKDMYIEELHQKISSLESKSKAPSVTHRGTDAEPAVETSSKSTQVPHDLGTKPSSSVTDRGTDAEPAVETSSKSTQVPHDLGAKPPSSVTDRGTDAEPAVETSSKSTQVPQDVSAKPPSKVTHRGTDAEQETEIDAGRSTRFIDLFLHAPWYLKLMWLLLCIVYVWNFFATYSERRMWLDANAKPWLTGDIYHGYMARQHAPSAPLFNIQPGAWINWIEYDVLGYLETLPG